MCFFICYLCSRSCVLVDYVYLSSSYPAASHLFFFGFFLASTCCYVLSIHPLGSCSYESTKRRNKIHALLGGSTGRKRVRVESRMITIDAPSVSRALCSCPLWALSEPLGEKRFIFFVFTHCTSSHNHAFTRERVKEKDASATREDTYATHTLSFLHLSLTLLSLSHLSFINTLSFTFNNYFTQDTKWESKDQYPQHWFRSLCRPTGQMSLLTHSGSTAPAPSGSHATSEVNLFLHAQKENYYLVNNKKQHSLDTSIFIHPLFSMLGSPSVHGAAKVTIVEDRKVQLTGHDGIILETITNVRAFLR